MIKRYLKLFKALFRFGLQSELEFRANWIFWSLENLLWLLLSVVSVELIFGQVSSIAGFSKNEMLLILFVASLFSDLFWTFIFPSLGNFSNLIRLGNLDSYLVKPVNLRFLLSFRVMEFDHYVRIILEFFLIYKYTLLVSGQFNLLNLLVFIFLFVCGIIIFYSLFFALTVTNIWFVNLHNLVDFFNTVKSLGEQPVYIFKKELLTLFSYLIPVGFIATFPTEALLGRFSLVKFFIAPLLAFIIYFLSAKFFTLALRHYTSASS